MERLYYNSSEDCKLAGTILNLSKGQVLQRSVARPLMNWAGSQAHRSSWTTKTIVTPKLKEILEDILKATKEIVPIPLKQTKKEYILTTDALETQWGAVLEGNGTTKTIQGKF